MRRRRSRFRWGILVVGALALGGPVVGPAAAFDVAECDGDSTLGNAGILLGWAAGTYGAVTVDNNGMGGPANQTVPAPITPAHVAADWEAARVAWNAVTNAQVAIPPTASGNVDAALLQATLSAGDATRVWHVIQPSTQKAGPPVTTGWTAITGTDNCSFLGLTFTVFNTSTRRLLDADILINDDPAAPGPTCPGGRAGFYSRAAGQNSLTHFDLRGIMLHEMGHFLGSDHTTQAGAAMQAAAPVGSDIDLAVDDFDFARFLYPAAANPTPPDRNDTTLTSCTSSGSTGTGAPPPTTPVDAGGGGGCAAAAGAGATGLGALLGLLLAGSWALVRPSGAAAPCRGEPPTR